VKYLLTLGVTLATVWLLWSGHLEPLLLALGLVSCALVLFLARRMGLVDEEGVPLSLFPRILLYVPWLMWEILKANVDVARRVLDPRLPIDPRVIRVRAGQRTPLGRTVYANSITLTPGTVSIDLAGDEITVHALSREAAEGLQTGEMDRRARWLEGDD